jgi:hypothetical protein
VVIKRGRSYFKFENMRLKTDGFVEEMRRGRLGRLSKALMELLLLSRVPQFCRSSKAKCSKSGLKKVY